MGDVSARYGLPLLSAGQAQKELLHNEAIVLLEQIVQPVVVATGVNTPPASPAPGAAWIVGGAPTGAWAGHGNALAVWTEGGWRFVAPIERMTVFSAASGTLFRYSGSSWTGATSVAGPTGGSVIDTQARTAITAILSALSAAGLVAP